MHGVEITEKDHRLLITVDTDVIDRNRIERALSLLDSESLLDEGLALAMEESADDEEFDLEEAKRIIGRK
ncbi:MAG TPA: hypothetical protein VFH95_16550 [Candidatus Kapabacteria bacterium]|nr:hypothetical protein [Candidatus Kapabacteria bacterium]